MITAAEQCQTGLEGFAEGMDALLGAAAEISRYGGGVSPAVVKVNVERSVQAFLFLHHRLNNRPMHQAPRSIASIAQLAAQFGSTAVARAESVISGAAMPATADAPPGKDEPSADYPEVENWDKVLAAEAAAEAAEREAEEAA
jgi:hypothetical protein